MHRGSLLPGVVSIGDGKSGRRRGLIPARARTDPANFSAAFNLGVVHSRRKQPEAAIQAFQRAVETLPDYAEAHEALGELYLYLNRPDDVVRELERAVAIMPKMAKAHYYPGRAYAALGRHEKAQQRLIAPRALNRGEVGRCSGRTV
ncbi:MAG: hypothetical protein DMG25_04215 [Acidobacteria bacterium]|nr:MAG: hypothetical protein DMG25_04215 [Acidobacteriota bacterium]